VKTRWREYSKHVVDEEEYKAVEQCSGGSRPKELFEYLIEDIEKEYEAGKVRRTVRDFVATTEWIVVR
jgi:pre-mRNA-processing factor 40